MFGTNNGIAGQVLVGFGTDEQKARWLEPIASGEVVASFALTEAGAGSNLSGLKTKATKDVADEDHCDQRPPAVHHQRPGGRPVHRLRPHPAADAEGPGIAVFLVPANTPGVEIGVKDEDGPEGAWTSGRELHRRPRGRDAPDRRQREDIGYRAAMTSLARGRIHIAALASARPSGRSTSRSPTPRTATQGGTPIGSFQLGAGDARRPADRRAGGPGLVQRRGAEVGCTTRDRRIARRWRNCSAPRWRARSPTWRCRCTAARATCAVSRSSGSTGRCVAAPLRGHQRDPAADHRRWAGHSAAHPVRPLRQGRVHHRGARGQGRAHAVKMAPRAPTSSPGTSPGKLPDCVPYDPASAEDLAETVALVEATG